MISVLYTLKTVKMWLNYSSYALDFKMNEGRRNDIEIIQITRSRRVEGHTQGNIDIVEMLRTMQALQITRSSDRSS